MKNRRMLLATLSAVSVAGSVEVWKKPVVNAIIIPVHAGTSLRCPTIEDADAYCSCACVIGTQQGFIDCLAELGLRPAQECEAPFACEC